MPIYQKSFLAQFSTKYHDIQLKVPMLTSLVLRACMFYCIISVKYVLIGEIERVGLSESFSHRQLFQESILKNQTTKTEMRFSFRAVDSTL